MQDRRQRQSDLLRFDPRTGQAGVILHEAVRDWINLTGIFHALPADNPIAPGGFIWATERGGFRHLWLHDRDGRAIRQLTDGEWMVDSLAGVDEASGAVYFVGTEAGPTERHLYQVPVAGGQPRRITVAPGWHTVKLDHSFRRFVDTHESLGQPPARHAPQSRRRP